MNETPTLLRASSLDLYWVPLTLTQGGVTLCLAVTGDAAKRDGKRIMVTAYEQQQLADELDASLLTPKLSDLIHLKADVTIEPVIQVPPGSGNIAATASSSTWNRYVDAALENEVRKWEKSVNTSCRLPLVSGVCKDWVLSSRLGSGRMGLATAVNHGWHSLRAPYRSATGAQLWQNEGAAHNDQHKDPSQCARFVAQRVKVEDSGIWRTVRFPDLLKSTKYAWLVSHDGPLKYVRQPRVPILP